MNINIIVSAGCDYMTYQEISMSFENYEHKEKIKLLYN